MIETMLLATILGVVAFGMYGYPSLFREEARRAREGSVVYSSPPAREPRQQPPTILNPDYSEIMKGILYVSVHSDMLNSREMNDLREICGRVSQVRSLDNVLLDVFNDLGKRIADMSRIIDDQLETRK